jgi:hypothetical protein
MVNGLGLGVNLNNLLPGKKNAALFQGGGYDD